LHAVDVPVVPVVIERAKQRVDEDATHKVNVNNHVMTQITLESHIHVIAAHHGVMKRVQVYSRFADLNPTNGEIEVRRRQSLGDGGDLRIVNLHELANRQIGKNARRRQRRPNGYRLASVKVDDAGKDVRKGRVRNLLAAIPQRADVAALFQTPPQLLRI